MSNIICIILPTILKIFQRVLQMYNTGRLLYVYAAMPSGTLCDTNQGSDETLWFENRLVSQISNVDMI